MGISTDLNAPLPSKILEAPKIYDIGLDKLEGNHEPTHKSGSYRSVTTTIIIIAIQQYDGKDK